MKGKLTTSYVKKQAGTVMQFYSDRSVRVQFMRKLGACLAVFSTSAFLCFGGNLFADTYTITPTGVDSTRGEGVWMNENGSNVSQYFLGVIFITLTDQQTGAQWNRDTLCVDLFTDINVNVTYGTTLLDPSVVPGKHLDRVAWLIDNALLPTQSSTASSQLPSSDWATTTTQGAGIQLAIWDIVHDNGDGFSSGSVQASTDPLHPTDPDVFSWANVYESLSNNQSSNAAYVYNNVSLSNGAPAQMLAGPIFTDNGPSPVPEPADWATIVLIGAIGLIAIREVRKITQHSVASTDIQF